MNIQLNEENVIRKIDSMGRLSIPKGIRDRFNWKDGDELSFFTFSYEGNDYVCASSLKSVDPRYMTAIAVLKELGTPVPQVLLDKIK